MFLSKEAVQAANERAKNLANSVPIVPRGPHVLKLSKLGIEETKSKKYIQAQLEFTEVSGAFRPISMNYIICDAKGEITQEWMQDNLTRLNSIFVNGFGFEPNVGENDTPQSYMKQFQKFVGQRVQGVVYHTIRIWKKSEQEMLTVADPEVRYVAKADGDAIRYDEAKTLVMPKAEDHALWNNFTGRKTDSFKVMNPNPAVEEKPRVVPAAAPMIEPTIPDAPLRDNEDADTPPSHVHVDLSGQEDPFK